MEKIHNCCYSSHNSLKILCSGKWTTPTWNPKIPEDQLPKDVYEDDEGDLYTFTSHLVSCENCIKKIFEDIHLCDWSQQPDIRIACTQEYTTPRERFHKPNPDLPKDVFEADENYLEDKNIKLYTFQNKLVSCINCLEKLK